jgi:hypothetical protein
MPVVLRFVAEVRLAAIVVIENSISKYAEFIRSARDAGLANAGLFAFRHRAQTP